MSTLPEILDHFVLKEGEYLVLTSEEPPPPAAFEAIPEEMRGRVLFVSGAKACALVEEVAQEFIDRHGQ